MTAKASTASLRIGAALSRSSWHAALSMFTCAATASHFALSISQTLFTSVAAAASVSITFLSSFNCSFLTPNSFDFSDIVSLSFLICSPASASFSSPLRTFTSSISISLYFIE